MKAPLDSNFETTVDLKLSTQWLGKNLLFYRCLDSTNNFTLKLARKKAPHGTVVWAREQTAGRGRGNKTWYSPPGTGLYFSILLYPPVPLFTWPLLSLVTGVAAAKALENKTGEAMGLKWPNDIWGHGHKLGGILTESQGQAVVIGIGLNINHDFFSPEFCQATSLFLLTQKHFVLEEVLADLLLHLERAYDAFFQGDKSFLSEWRKRNILKNKKVTIRTGDKITTGWVSDIDDQGALILEKAKGKTYAIVSGEVLKIE
ncbi:MAG: biotin--[acetyl-CoA-carboxylase] ligase [Candidatus Desulfofervidaceae bacterium]|nr:biotin--[acetyl-CoA-carboxylase] ligase [Candidatus Desulfofervidaceae bacterium]